MQRRTRIEDRDQQVITQFRVQPDPRVHNSLQPDVLLDHDQRAGLGRSQSRRGQHNLVINALPKLAVMASRKRNAEAVAKID